MHHLTISSQKHTFTCLIFFSCNAVELAFKLKHLAQAVKIFMSSTVKATLGSPLSRDRGI